VLRAVLNGDDTDEALMNRAYAAGINFSRAGRSAIIRLGGHSRDLTYRQLESIITDYTREGILACPLGNEIVLWIPTLQRESHDRPVRLLNKLAQELKRTAAVVHWFGGVGRIHAGMDGVRRSYREAQMAAQRASVDQIVFYDDLSIWEIFLQQAMTTLDTELAADYLSSLSDRDRQRLEQTVDALIAADFNMTKASDELRLHRNGLARRIQRLSDQLGVDLTKPQNILAVYAIIGLVRRLQEKQS
jgi:sugar diacid utilization regulator